eukprot:8507357-Pyramimonas_sp.AAC.2
MRTVVPAAGQASGSQEAEESRGVYPTVPDGWGNAQGTHPIPIALNGQAGQDSDEQLDDEDDINSMEEDVEYANYQCIYWRDPQGKEFMRELEFVKTALHGRAYGLRDSKGNFMKKPWAIASTSHDVTEGHERKCDGTHEH